MEKLTLVLAPFTVAGGLVVDSCQEVKVLERDLLLLDTQLVVELSLRRALDAVDGVGQGRARLARDVQRVGAASVGPQVGEGNLLFGALLEEQLVLVVEEEDGEGSVEEALVDVGHEMAYSWGLANYLFSTDRFWELLTDLFASSADGQVVLVQDDADLVHQADLFLVVAGQRFRGGIDVGEQTQHVLSRDGLRQSCSSGSRHCDVVAV